MKPLLFHTLRFLRGPVRLLLGLLIIIFALLVFSLTFALFAMKGARHAPMIIGDVFCLLLWFGCFVARFQYDALILRLQPESIDMTLFQ